MFRGIRLLYTVLFDIKDHEHLVTTVQTNMDRSYITFNAISGILGETQQRIQRQERPTDGDRMREERFLTPFTGDSLESAPLAWTEIWRGTYSNLYGYYIPDELRPWGFTFWDVATLTHVGGQDLLKRQWASLWDDDDPRDDLF